MRCWYVQDIFSRHMVSVACILGGLPYGTDGDGCWKFDPKGDHLGVAQAFCNP